VKNNLSPVPRLPNHISEIYPLQKPIKRIKTPYKTTNFDKGNERPVFIEKQDVRYLYACVVI
jgi:hypothetical protein